MRLKFVASVILLGLSVVAQGQSAVNDMVKTEQSFSAMAEDKSIREAFMAFIADDGLLFRPGAVNGKQWMIEHPVPASDKNPLLAWQPAFAGMSLSGDLGFTTGPWEFKADRTDPTPSGYGDFVTVWKKQADGSWKFVVDLGISHPQSGGPLTLWQPPAPDPNKKTSFKPVDESTALGALLERDRNYASAQRKQALAAVFPVYAGRDVRLYRPNNLPYVGVQAATEALATPKGRIKWKPIGGDVSLAGDLGYTHGTYEVTDDTKNVIEKGSYVRIWKKRNGMWRIVMDVANQH
ncbi:MAG TPA: nuclear transport factor 2 family protein [Pyrinomonadaceae bacterium]|nr:nuclear transport factor 2 family protein [Pyrinomonadaceae bacterium]